MESEKIRSDTAKILIVEDDTKLALLLSEYLSVQGFEVCIESLGDHAVSRIVKENPDIVILDLMLPGLDGFEICRQARKQYSNGIMMLTARKTEIDQAVGLEIGADDYVLKPVEPRILLARIRSLLRRLRPSQRLQLIPEKITIGLLTVDRTTREVFVGTNKVPFTSFEFDLLWLLSSRVGEVVTRDTLYQDLRGIQYDGLDRSIDIHVSRIKSKLREYGMDSNCIRAIRGSGYLIVRQK